MVSREFLVTQSVLNALRDHLPATLELYGASYAAMTLQGYMTIDREDHWFLRDVRKHFAILDRREREAADVVRLDAWREAAGLK